MNLDLLILMRHELLLVAAVLIMLVADLNVAVGQKGKMVSLSIILFGVITVLGFLPAEQGVIFGGMYQTDALRVLMKNVLNLGVLIIFIQSGTWLKNDPENQNRISEFYILITATLIGMNYMISSGDFIMFYLGIELATIPLAALVAYQRYESKSAEAGIKMILSAAFSSGVALMGISMIYATSGSVYFDEVAAVFKGNQLQILGMLLFFVGLAFKISIVPFHLWTADVYEGAPTNVTSYLSVISKGAAVFILIILLFTVFKTVKADWSVLLYITSVLTMTFGNLFAIRQQNLKRFLAFSSIAQAGFILLGMIGGTKLGMTSVIYFILIYAFSNLGAFGVVVAISNMTGKETRDDYNGLYKTNPKLSLVMMLSLFSLAGIPPVAGFFGKFFLFTAAAESGYYILVLIATINATIALYYYLLVVKAMFINKSDQPIEHFQSDVLTKTGLLICVLGMLMIGFASPIFEFIHDLSIGA